MVLSLLKGLVMNNRGEKLLGLIGVVMFVVIFAFIITAEYMSCDGTLVRGLFWFECVGVSNE